jgi:type II secretory pathway pseudopilin PulG
MSLTDHGPERASASSRESGISIVEMLIVLAIVGVLLAITITSMVGGKQSARGRSAEISARAYASAVLDFAIDNRGVIPEVGTADWPTADAERGPLNAFASRAGQRYLNGAPPAIQDGTVRFVVGAVPGGNDPVVTYERIALTQYRVTAWVDGRRVCEVANVPLTTGVRAC